jgi:hypothetical protein
MAPVRRELIKFLLSRTRILPDLTMSNTVVVLCETGTAYNSRANKHTPWDGERGWSVLLIFLVFCVIFYFFFVFLACAVPYVTRPFMIATSVYIREMLCLWYLKASHNKHTLTFCFNHSSIHRISKL